ncbi:hypothetical protein O181_082094 [Austropuccinia psidii MF-1]|uniref:Uncharacterized protein n=1 Tax=Austropuccinia psidii MF-1 TaxID=1389203 RepID=A0A9Q3IKQ3_9BASI|nr:hypothetical protein [Austropuccinia psidii MF-1]
MNLRGIGGNCTSIVELAEFPPITLVTGEERNIHLFVARGAVHTVLERPFLADNNIRLDFSQQKGEILSYIELDGRRICLPICSPQKVGWREKPPAGMDLCKASKIAISEEHPQVFKLEEIKEYGEKMEIKRELSSNDTEDIKPKPKEINLKGITTPRRENGNACNQRSQAINSYNFRNPEEIRRKPVTKLLSPIKESKSFSKGIFKNNWISSVKPVMSIINVTEEARDLDSCPDTSALYSLKEISLKYKIIINTDLKPQDIPIIQEESIKPTSKSKQSEELNKSLENIIDNQPTNENYDGQDTSKGESEKTNKDNTYKSKSLLPKEVTSPPIGFSQISQEEVSHREDNNDIQKAQLFPSKMINVEPRLCLENKDITKQNLQNSKIETRKS